MKYLSAFEDVRVMRLARNASFPLYDVEFMVREALPTLNHTNFQLKYISYISVSPLLNAVFFMGHCAVALIHAIQSVRISKMLSFRVAVLYFAFLFGSLFGYLLWLLFLERS